MSLKAFHIVFITASTLLAVGFATWSFWNYYSDRGSKMDLLYGALSVVVAIALVVYGRYVLKKLKNISNL